MTQVHKQFISSLQQGGSKKVNHYCFSTTCAVCAHQ